MQIILILFVKVMPTSFLRVLILGQEEIIFLDFDLWTPSKLNHKVLINFPHHNKFNERFPLTVSLLS